MGARDLIFFSYRNDAYGEPWLSLIQSWLKPYELDGVIKAWSDREIRTGDQWDARIRAAIERTRVAVLLVNQTFFSSEYIRNVELPELIQGARTGALKLVVVPIGPCHTRLLEQHGLLAFQFSHPPDSPLSLATGSQREVSLTKVAIKIHEAYGTPASSQVTECSMPLKVAGAPAGPSADRSRSDEPALAPLYEVPDLDRRHFVPRREAQESLRKELLAGDAQAHGVTATAPGLGLHGMGGMGKSVLAQALCLDREVRLAFPDGVAWITLGQDPEMLLLQNRLLRDFSPSTPPAESMHQAQRLLRSALEERRVLLVIDDIWDARHFASLDLVGPKGRLLLTTRNSAILGQIGARVHELRGLPEGPARQVLASWSGCPVADLPPEASAIVADTQGLPLALALAGAQAAEGVDWATLAHELRQGHLRFLDHPHGSVFASIGRSVDHLPPEERERYLELAVFPEDSAIPASTVRCLWAEAGMSEPESARLLGRLARKALLTLDGQGEQARVSLHDLLHDFVRARCVDRRSLHARLLDAHRSAYHLASGPTAWSKMPPHEPYLWPWLAYHMAEAGRQTDLEQHLLCLDHLGARLRSVTRGDPPLADVAAMVEDFKFVPGSPAMRQMARCLQRSAHVLSKRPDQLGLQLFGRLVHSRDETLKRLASEGLACHGGPCLVPGLPSLQPLGALVAEFSGHQSTPHGVLLLPDGRRALSWSNESTLRLWDLDQPGAHQVLSGHETSVVGALLLPDGRRALSWSFDHTLRLWDLDRPGAHQVLSGHEDMVRGAHLTSDGRRALSWSEDNTLRLWELDKPGAHQVLSGHAEWIRGVHLLSDGRRALSWSVDHTVRLWNLDHSVATGVLSLGKDQASGALPLPDGRRALCWMEDSTLRLWDLDDPGSCWIMSGHTGAVGGLLLLPDSRHVLTWSFDTTLRLWDLDQPGSHQILAGHEGPVEGALLLPEGRRALSWSYDSTLRLWDLEHPGSHRVLSGHEAVILGALLLPDGRRALSWSDDRTLRLWDLDHPGSHQVLSDHKDLIGGALLLPDGQRALSLSFDCSLRLWDLDPPGQGPELAGHGDAVRGALPLSDDRHVLSWSYDSTLRLWDLDRPGSHQVLSGHEDMLRGAQLLPGGLRALSWSDDHTLRLWDLEHPGAHQVLSGHEKGIGGAQLLPDGRRALSWSYDETLRLWELDHPGSHQVLPLGHEDRVRGVELLPDGRHALAWMEDHSLRLWDLDHPGACQRLGRHEDAVFGVLPLPDGRRAISWSYDRTLRLWYLGHPGKHLVLSGHQDAVIGAIALPGGRRALSWSPDSTLRLWNLDQPGAQQVLRGHEAAIPRALLLPGGARAISWSHDNTLRLWDLDHPGAHQVLSGHDGGVLGARLLPGGRRALSWADDRTLRYWDLEQAKELDTWFADANVTAVALTTDGTKAFVGDALGLVQIFSMRAPLPTA